MSTYYDPITTSEFMEMSSIVARLNDAVARFGKGGYIRGVEWPSPWRQLEALVSKSEHRYHCALIGGNEVNVGSLIGRVLITIRRGMAQVTLIGLEGEPERGTNIQSIDAAPNEAVEMIDLVIQRWDQKAFRPNPQATIA